MSIEIPADFQPFIQSMIAGGQYQSEEEVVVAALSNLRSHLEQLRSEVLPALDRCQAGGGIVVDDAGLRKLKEDIRNRARTAASDHGG